MLKTLLMSDVLLSPVAEHRDKLQGALTTFDAVDKKIKGVTDKEH